MKERNNQFISNGNLLPLSERANVEARTKKSKISEVEVRMKKKIASIFYATGKTLRQVKDQVGLYVAHFRSGQDEQTEFLKFYSNNEVFTVHSHLGVVKTSLLDSGNFRGLHQRGGRDGKRGSELRQGVRQ